MPPREFDTADRCRVEVTLTRTETIAISVEGPLDLPLTGCAFTERTATPVGQLGPSPWEHA